MSDTVYTKSDTTIGMPDGAVYKLRTSEPWDADDPVVKAHPNHFTKEAPKVRTATGWVRRSARAVEDATAAPGKKRNR